MTETLQRSVGGPVSPRAALRPRAFGAPEATGGPHRPAGAGGWEGYDFGVSSLGLTKNCAITALSALTVACALTYHTAPRYRFYPPAAEEAAQKAADYCRDLGEPAGTPERPFLTDGCSMWPDGVWQECCVAHDMAYWCGGTEDHRKSADDRLAACVSAEYAGWMAALMRAGVWVGGPPWIPARWRWGYGHRYPAGYAGE
jgi:hypothetical protein